MSEIEQLKELLKQRNNEVVETTHLFENIEYVLDELQQKENIIKEVRKYITSYESIDTIQGLEDIEKNQNFDGKTMIEMVRRYMIVHDKLLEILDKENENE